MSDDADRAQLVEEAARAHALARAAAAPAETPFEIEGVRVCLDCFEPVPLVRLVANPRAVRCVECQWRIEKHRAARGRG
jgi:DnaK suppressor protein